MIFKNIFIYLYMYMCVYVYIYMAYIYIYMCVCVYFFLKYNLFNPYVLLVCTCGQNKLTHIK